MKPEPREKLRQASIAADNIIDDGRALNYFQWLVTPSTVLSLIAQVEALTAQVERAERALVRGGFVDHGAQEWKPPLGPAPKFIEVEALTVPQVYIVEADYNYDGNQAVRAFSCKVDAETFAAAVNAYQESEPRTSWGDAEHKAWAAAHPVREFAAADGFDIADVPFGLPTIPAIPGTKERA